MTSVFFFRLCLFAASFPRGMNKRSGQNAVSCHTHTHTHSQPFCQSSTEAKARINKQSFRSERENSRASRRIRYRVKYRACQDQKPTNSGILRLPFYDVGPALSALTPPVISTSREAKAVAETGLASCPAVCQFH